jgi:surface antigen
MRASGVLLSAIIMGSAALLGTQPADAAVERSARRSATSPATMNPPAARRPAAATTRSTSATRPRSAANPNIRRAVYRSGGGGISCVPYARAATGMEISGNGRDWWHNAAGRYERGNRPQAGAVLAFPGSGGMRSGHVAVVERVVGPREISIHHANWGGPGIRRGTVMRGVRVIDVSDRNDWTAVKVQTGWDRDTFGRTYPTYGFIYDRPVGGGMVLASAPRQPAFDGYQVLTQRVSFQPLGQ